MKFPARPQLAPEGMTEVSPAFKKEASKVLLSIVFFLVVYVLLILAAIGLSIALGYLGVYIVMTIPRFITLMVGIALVLVGVMVLYFLIKFIFSSNKVDRSEFVEITREEEPDLFEFIDKVNAETDSPKPKRIYLSNQVNASVFYDSSFWSMFFPVKKNLNIGLGVVNSVNLTEFKAIMAHEFGHFSQKSMKLGSYIYNVNRVIYNMLFENEGFERNLIGMSESSGYWAITGYLTMTVVRGIQWVLQGVYTVVNKSYMSLSRQMEFHADAISASVTGSNHMGPALQRIQIADICYNFLLEKYNAWVGENIRPENLYPNHTYVLKHISEGLGFEVKEGLLVPNEEEFKRLQYSKLSIEDQWASHPSYDQRVESLEKYKLNTEPVEDSVWTLFRDPVQTQKRFTDILFQGVAFGEEAEILNEDSFVEKFTTEDKELGFPEAYEGFYDYNFPSDIDIDKLDENREKVLAFADIFEEDRIAKFKENNFIYSDQQMLEQINRGEIKVKSFDYDGKKYKKSDAYTILNQVNAEVADREKEVELLNKQALSFFLFQAEQKSELATYKHKFKTIQRADIHAKSSTVIYTKFLETMAPIFHGSVSIEQAKEINGDMRYKETDLKREVKYLLEYEAERESLSEEELALFTKYLSSSMEYFAFENFNEGSINYLMEVLSTFVQIRQKLAFQFKKDFLEYQISLLPA